MAVPERARLVRIELEGELSAAEGCLLVRGDERPFALAGDWAGGGALVGSEPLVVAAAGRGPVRAARPAAGGGGRRGRSGAVGGGWFGYLGYNLGARLERVPPPPPRHVPLPDFTLAFYDHLLRLDADGRWWFEALWTDERDAELRARLELLRARLAEGVRERPVWVGTFQPAPPGGAGHMTAIDECRERIAAGEIFQANLCLRLEAEWQGDPLDLFARTAGTLEPRHAGLVAGPWGAVCSLSPELFLRRRGREVVSEPIKGTAPRVLAAGREGTRAEDTRAALAASTKDRAENVMIVDLMRNDLGRVCEYGSIRVPALTEPRPAPGVWHLVSTVTGTLRPDAGDADLLRASFPPGSVTGAPKIQAMRVIAELEAGGREAYTGAIGYASPVAGLELNVAIRTLEMRGERIWMGAGGGIVADSVAERELEECFVKARPVIAAAGARLIEEPRVSRVAPVPGAGRRSRPARPGPRRVRDAAGARRRARGRPRAPRPARAQRERAVRRARLPEDLLARVIVAAAAAAPLAAPAGAGGPAERGRRARSRSTAEPLARRARRPNRSRSRPRSSPAASARTSGATAGCSTSSPSGSSAVPLLVDLDGDVLEAAYANVFIVEGDAPGHAAARRPAAARHRARAGARAASRARGAALARPHGRRRRAAARLIGPRDPPGAALRRPRAALPARRAPARGPARGQPRGGRDERAR